MANSTSGTIKDKCEFLSSMNDLKRPPDSLSIALIIPCYKGGLRTLEVIRKAKCFATDIILVDDCCPLNTGDLVLEVFKNESNIHVIFNNQNFGVGMSTKIGFDYAVNCNILVKIDADGQMDPCLIPSLIEPLIQGKSDAAKGNRFTSVDHIASMPKIRIIGNLVLSFLNKISTGYWELFDPTNGFIAITSTALSRIRLDKVDNRYFFESDLLFQCALARITFSQLSMKSIYDGEVSSLSPIAEIRYFSAKHLLNFIKRLFYQYFILDFNAGSLELLGGLISFFFSFLLFLKILLFGLLYNIFATPGESSLFAIVSLLTIQLFIGFLYYDSTQQPLLRQLSRQL